MILVSTALLPDAKVRHKPCRRTRDADPVSEIAATAKHQADLPDIVQRAAKSIERRSVLTCDLPEHENSPPQGGSHRALTYSQRRE
jgi:hypothetical protein